MMITIWNLDGDYNLEEFSKSKSYTSICSHIYVCHRKMACIASEISATSEIMGCYNAKAFSTRKLSLRKEDVVLRVPGGAAYLIQDEVAFEIARGTLTIARIVHDGVPLAAYMEVGSHLLWPLTKDEPVVELDRLHYLFTLPDKHGRRSFLNYGVSFNAALAGDGRLASLNAFLKGNTCFSNAAADGSTPSAPEYWKDYAPKVEDYNGILAKAIAQGTGKIVKGIFKISHVYANQVQKGAALFQPQASVINRSPAGGKENGEINKAIKRARKLSEMTEKMSRSLLDGVILVTGSVAAPLVQSKAGQSFLNSMPGEFFLVTLDAVYKVLEAVEVAERKALAASSGAVAGAVSKRLGENAGEATEDALATAGHAIGTALNVIKISEAINPASYRSSMLKNVVSFNKT